MKRILSAMAAVAVILAGLTATSTPAEASTHDAVIKYESGPISKLMVCRSAHSPTECGSGVAWIKKGQNTKTALGWKDADLFWLDAGRRAGGFRGPRWVKVAGCGGCTYHAYIN